MIPVISALIPLVGKLIDRAVPDKKQAAELTYKVTEQLHSLSQEELKGAVNIILAEASGGVLQRNWRPLTMLSFVGIVIYSAIGPSMFGLPAVDMSGIPPQAWQVMMLGIGGYVVGRSGEKIAKTWREK